MAFPGHIDNLEKLAHQHCQRSSIHALAPGIVAHTDDFWLVRVVDIQREIIPRKRPVEGFRGKSVQRNAGRSYLALQLFERLVLDGIGKGVALDFQLVELLQNLKYRAVILPHEFNQMREGAVAATVVNLQEPDEKVHIAPGRQREEIVPLGILPVGVFQYDFCNLRGIHGVGQISGMDGIEAVRVQRVIEIDDIELGLDVIAAVVVQQLVHHQTGQAGILVVVDKHRVALLHHLPDEGGVDAGRLTGTGGADDHTSALRSHAIDIAVMEFSLILVGHRNIDTVLVLNQLPALFERVPILGKMGIETPHHPPQQDGSHQIHHITGQRQEHIEPAVAAELSTKEQQQPGQKRQQNLQPG